uniref:Beta-Casp domain-containing protein n=1 Tax=Ascaris lumbricoides TaxID=6252 RepID=A0A0M3I1Y7_ASCLU
MSLSWQPNRPCILLKWPSASILLDCAVDFATLSSCLPLNTKASSRFDDLPPYRSGSSIDYLKACCDQVFVDAPLEVHPVPLHLVSINSIDAILVSNWMSLLALPFFTERSEFRGTVYATDPTLQLGRLVMEEMLEYLERSEKTKVDEQWKQHDVFANFPNVPSSDPREWIGFYTRAQMQHAIARNVSDVLTITAYSSGYSIGSCNWVIRTEHEKIGYLSATSSRNSHTKAVDWDQLRGSDALILTSICRFPEHSPDNSVCNVFTVMAETLKKNGSVLMPMCPTGVLYDLLEVITVQLDQQGVPMDIPVYFISPVAESSIAFSNIYPEWLSDKKQNMAYFPEEPFTHAYVSYLFITMIADYSMDLMKCGRLKVFESLHGALCHQLKTPCILFTGHPSLRFGEAVRFLELWGNNPRNAIIMTDPDYPLKDVYGPYQNLAIRAFFYPIDTRLDYSQLNPSIMPDLSPKLLLMPEAYVQPPATAPQRVDFVVTHNPHTTFRYGDMLTIPSITKRKRIRLHPELLKSLNLRARGEQSDVGICALKGYLCAYDNILELKLESTVEAEVGHSVDSIRSHCIGKLSGDSLIRALQKLESTVEAEVGHSVDAIRSHCIGKLSGDSLIRALQKKNIKATLETSNGCTIVKMAGLHAEVRIEADGHRTRIFSSSKETRQKIADIVAHCLKALQD